MSNQTPNPLSDEPQTPEEARATYRLELAVHAFDAMAEVRDIVERVALPNIHGRLRDHLHHLVDTATAAIEADFERYWGEPPYSLEEETQKRELFLKYIADWDEWVTRESVALLKRVQAEIDQRSTPGQAEEGEAA